MPWSPSKEAVFSACTGHISGSLQKTQWTRIWAWTDQQTSWQAVLGCHLQMLLTQFESSNSSWPPRGPIRCLSLSFQILNYSSWGETDSEATLPILFQTVKCRNISLSFLLIDISKSWSSAPCWFQRTSLQFFLLLGLCEWKQVLEPLIIRLKSREMCSALKHEPWNHFLFRETWTLEAAFLPHHLPCLLSRAVAQSLLFPLSSFFLLP